MKQILIEVLLITLSVGLGLLIINLIPIPPIDPGWGMIQPYLQLLK